MASLFKKARLQILADPLFAIALSLLFIFLFVGFLIFHDMEYQNCADRLVQSDNYLPRENAYYLCKNNGPDYVQ